MNETMTAFLQFFIDFFTALSKFLGLEIDFGGLMPQEPEDDVAGGDDAPQA